MLSSLSKLGAALAVGLKPLKYFVDSVIRDKVWPVEGSVLYCDLWLAVEHSGIYLVDGKISNIEVDGLAESEVRLCGPRSFTANSTLGRKIYVSCDKHGPVGDGAVGRGAESHVGERAFYGLVIKNCHQFSTKCVNYAGNADVEISMLDRVLSLLPDSTWEPTLGALKAAAREKLGATKWRLWDWDGEEERNPPPEPDWQAHSDAFRNLPLDAETIAHVRAELAAARAYEEEIAGEAISPDIRGKLAGFGKTLSDISARYDEVKDFLGACPGAGFSYAQIEACKDDFAALAAALKDNPRIRELTHKMGRDYISEAKKKRSRVPEASKSELHGTHCSGDVMRVLPSELLNLEDDTLETLFYARLLEENLLTYELRGTVFVEGEVVEQSRKRTGPVVACLDTSGSMQGAPLLKAKALLLAIAGILQKEDRSLHVLLFGAAGEIREFSMDARNDAAGLLAFLQQGFGGGTDFESPLRQALHIIEHQDTYRKADVLMISDGDCGLSPEFTQFVQDRKQHLDCSVYSVLCAGSRVEDGFSDEVVVL